MHIQNIEVIGPNSSLHMVYFGGFPNSRYSVNFDVWSLEMCKTKSLQSMKGLNAWYENAVMESYRGSFKREPVIAEYESVTDGKENDCRVGEVLSIRTETFLLGLLHTTPNRNLDP